VSYFDIYKARLNRHGATPTERLNSGREANFEKFMHQSPHYVAFYADSDVAQEKPIECVFEPSSQKEDKTVMHVLCRVGQKFEVGDIYTIAGERYLFWYWDERKDSGYNRWTVVRVSQPIHWVNEDGSEHDGEAYIYGQMDNMLKNELKSRSRSATLYLENLKLEFMIMPVNKDMKINSYLAIEVKGIKKNYRVTGFDHVTTPGVMYVSMDPTLERDMTEAPKKTENDDANDFFWLGGVN
jgi:hypothetical protein